MTSKEMLNKEKNKGDRVGGVSWEGPLGGISWEGSVGRDQMEVSWEG